MASFVEPSSLEQLLENENLQTIFVGGKGGVGKTTCSSSIAIQFAKSRPDEKILLVSTDPAHNISDAFLQQFSGEPQNVHGIKNLFACEIDPTLTVESDLETIKAAAVEGMSLNDDKVAEMSKFINEFKQWVESVPGIDEAMALSSVLSYIESGEYSLLVFDTAPTGHTIRLLQLPTVLKVGLEKLQSWKSRLGGMFAQMASFFYQDSAATAQQRAMKKVEEKLETYHTNVTKIAEIFKDNLRTEFVCVCNASFLSVYETKRLISELKVSKIACYHVIVNMLMPRAFSNVTPETGGANAIYEALHVKCNLDEITARAVKDAVELCGGISRIQENYLKVLADAEGTGDEPVKLTFLPLLPAEVRGVASFSERLKRLDPRLSLRGVTQQTDTAGNVLTELSSNLEQENGNVYVADTESKFMKKSVAMEAEIYEEEEMSSYEAEVLEQLSIGDTVEIYGLKKAQELNGKTGKLGKLNEYGRYEVRLGSGKRPLLVKPDNLRRKRSDSKEKVENDSKQKPSIAMDNVTPEMMNLVQQTLMKPGGIQEVLNHHLVKEMKTGDDTEMKTFFNDIETNGLFAGLKYLSNKNVMSKLAVVAREIQGVTA
eukprot:CAMPEP_0204865282 /NCGR_PEP_ID=MMETSP1348-20121228/7189_1 /ASSEMBLY_ACC=CAM_ASM_000700 /TAXON_ID=215587 /ORGANISM="Aplanochytrium stocchinoi, Strain GSBS06" /LENGTH=600 /DNA_ID=CAMNT_0052016383 /DNA_START=92 /DNA_END=1895 /DNA_ORIENTATION=+